MKRGASTVEDPVTHASTAPSPARTRVSIFLGKGGVGKTTLAAAVALDRARAGERVLLVSATTPRDLAERLRNEGDGGSGNLEFDALDPRELVDAIFRKLLNLGPVVAAILKSPSYASFIEIAPGLRELAFLNYVYNASKSGRYDRVIVDGPATGHGLHFLEAPERAQRLLVGQLAARAERITAMLRDTEATEVVLVTLPEEMPVREAIDLATKLEDMQVNLDNVVVNRWLPNVFDAPDAVRVLDAYVNDRERRRALARAIAPHTRIDVDEWISALHLVRAQRSENTDYLVELEKLAAKLHIVPHVTLVKGRLVTIAETLRRTHATRESGK